MILLTFLIINLLLQLKLWRSKVFTWTFSDYLKNECGMFLQLTYKEKYWTSYTLLTLINRGNSWPKLHQAFGCCPWGFIFSKNLFYQKQRKYVMNIGVTQIRGILLLFLWGKVPFYVSARCCFQPLIKLMLVLMKATLLNGQH